MTLKLDETDSGKAIISIKEQLRKLPSFGIGYGILRYLCNDRNLTEKLTAVHQANILYNYLGQFSSHDQSEAVFEMTDENCGYDHDLSGPRTHWLEIDAMVMDNQLKLKWVYSENIHKRETIENLANNFIHALQDLMKHCLSSEAGGVSASDFPEAALDQEDLEDLLGMLKD